MIRLGPDAIINKTMEKGVVLRESAGNFPVRGMWACAARGWTTVLFKTVLKILWHFSHWRVKSDSSLLEYRLDVVTQSQWLEWGGSDPLWLPILDHKNCVVSAWLSLGPQLPCCEEAQATRRGSSACSVHIHLSCSLFSLSGSIGKTDYKFLEGIRHTRQEFFIFPIQRQDTLGFFCKRQHSGFSS